jgi:hypothetical protein
MLIYHLAGLWSTTLIFSKNTTNSYGEEFLWLEGAINFFFFFFLKQAKNYINYFNWPCFVRQEHFIKNHYKL